MKTRRTNPSKAVRWLSTPVLFGVLFTLIFPVGAWAAGTPAGTDIENMATINYSVGGGSTITINSSPDGNTTIGAGGGSVTMFEVDRLVDLTVTRVGATYTDVPANGSGVVLTFTVANSGNATLDFGLDALNLASGTADPYSGSDNQDVTVVDVYVDSDGSGPTASYDPTAHSYIAAADTATVISSLAQDQSINVYVVANVPADATNGQIAAILMRATGLEIGGGALSETAGADATDMVDTVFRDDDADGAGSDDSARNAQDIDYDAFRIQAAGLTVTKISRAVQDPFNGTTNPKAIPGAFVEYEITITNAAASATATSVTITDDLSALVGGATPLMNFRVDGYAAGQGIRVTAPDIGTDVDLTNVGDADQGDWNATGANTVTVNCGNLDAGESATVVFQLEIN